MKMKIFCIILILLIFTINAFSFSPNEAINFVSRTNNYFLDNETAIISSPQVQIEYNNEFYWIVLGVMGDQVGVYIPVSNQKEIASGSIEIRELISTRIVLERMFQLRNSYPASDWPFSHLVKNRFFDIENELRNLSPSISNVKIDLENISGANDLVLLAESVKTGIDSLAQESKEIAELVDEGINFEKDFFSNPKNTQRKDYEDLTKKYFDKLDIYKNNFNEVRSDLDTLRQGIGSFQGEMTNDQKQFYLSILRLPSQTNALNSFFSLTDTIKSIVEDVFLSSRNIQNFVLNLETRKNRNDAWQMLYGFDSQINNLNNNFSNLDEAARSILSEDNVSFWIDQDNVTALRVNYRQSVENYNRGIYDKSINFGRDSKRNVENILKSGFEEPIENSGELIMQIIILLIVLLVIIFLAEKFYFNKKKKETNEYYEGEFYEN